MLVPVLEEKYCDSQTPLKHIKNIFLEMGGCARKSLNLSAER
jgi:hypothetical protein